VTGLSIYAWKDWFKSLCGLICMMAFIQHEDMPSNVFGIQGLNAWNILFLMILLSWMNSRGRQHLKWDMPRNISMLLLMYFGVIVTGVFRAILDRNHIEAYSIGSLISEELINTIKWVLPGILLFDGCRTRRQMVMALSSLLLVYVMISVQVIKRVPLKSAIQTGGSGLQKMRLRQCRRIGYSAPDLSAMLAGASWGMLASLPLARSKRFWTVILAAAGVIVLGQALTGGRAGYAAWGATGLTLCLLKWRKYLILAPVVIILLPILFPGAAERMSFGFGKTDVTGQAMIDDYEVTSGRSVIWPFVLEKIAESPWVGYGRLAMNRTGLTGQLASDLKETFPHPHSMYFETLLDNGILGSLPILVFWVIILVISARLFRHDNRLYSATGGLALTLMAAQLFAGVGAQHFYPRESNFGAWTAMFLALRVYVEERRAQVTLVAQPVWGTPAAMPPRPVASAHVEEVAWQ